MKLSIAQLFALAFCLSLQGCFVSQEALQQEGIRGTLFDSNSEAPLEDAYVILQWSGQIAHFPEAYPKCLHMEAVKTDKAGTFVFQPWIINGSAIKSSIRAIWFVFLPGHELQSVNFKPSSNEKYFLKNYSGTTESWIVSTIDAVGSLGCGEGGEVAKSELLFYDNLLLEIEALPGGAAPVNFRGTMITARKHIHEQKCLAAWQATQSDLPEKKITREAYDQCLKRP